MVVTKEKHISTVELTNGYKAFVNLEDYPLVCSHNWHSSVRFDRLGNVRTVYAQTDIKVGSVWKTVFMHRLLLGLPVGLQVDHEDGNGLNNTRDNLRLATSSQNQHNKGLGHNNKSGYKGVSFDKQYQKWSADIYINYKRIKLGRFDTKEEAAKVYAEASERHHKDFGRVV